jgi:NAD(P)-dependent dehydrogenase (short-subunit alcohol dehydrogenase family)
MGQDSKLGKGNGGRIVLNGSMSAHVPRPDSAPCKNSDGARIREQLLKTLFFSHPDTSSKHAVTGLAKSLSLDGRKQNIVVSQIDIGNAATVSRVLFACQ